MNAWLACPLAVRLAILAAVGAGLGGLVNWAVFALAFAPRRISPWSTPLAEHPRRNWLDRLPIAGWHRLRGETHIHGAGFWVRPLLIECSLAILLPVLYAWEVDQQGLIPVIQRLAAPSTEMLHAQFASHVVLILLMLAASFIDIDEKFIPDAITVPGTLIGLILAAVLPISQLPIVQDAPLGAKLVAPIRIASPLDWPPVLSGAGGLAIGLACYGVWCIALVERPWRARRGFVTAMRLLFARMLRGLRLPVMLAIILVGTGGIFTVWRFGTARWEALLTALVGMAVSGGVVWIVRIIGYAALRREAMGFGDVTLMGMIGAYLGWQAGLMIFFLAPLAGLAIGLLQWLWRGEHEIPYGPFLCLAALVLIIDWAAIWDWADDVFKLGWLIPGIVGVGFVLMAILLTLWRFASDRWFPMEE